MTDKDNEYYDALIDAQLRRPATFPAFTVATAEPEPEPDEAQEPEPEPSEALDPELVARLATLSTQATTRRAIITYLWARPEPATSAEIAAALGYKLDGVTPTLAVLVRDGYLGRYRSTPKRLAYFVADCES